MKQRFARNFAPAAPIRGHIVREALVTKIVTPGVIPTHIVSAASPVLSQGTAVSASQPTSSFALAEPSMVTAAKGPAPVPRLTLTRPHGPLGLNPITNLELLREHGFVFNRKPFRSDLGDITPKDLDAFDRANYRRDGPYLVSRHNPDFVLADVGRVSKDTIIAMLALGRSLVMRVPVRRPDGSVRTLSVYIVSDHTWALWGWVEAAARGELAWQGNMLVHVDDHSDMLGFESRPRVERLTLETVTRIIEEQVKWKQDPAGIASFISAAAHTGFLGSIFWEYGIERTADTERQYETRRNSSISMAKLCVYPGSANGNDDWIVNGALLTSMLSLGEIQPHNDYTHFGFPDEFYRRFPGKLSAHRSDCFPFYETDLEGPLRGDRRLILDIDIDVQDKLTPVYLIASQHFAMDQRPDCMTIAISPQFGALDNHVLKVASILSLIGEFM
jgi:hypothetical protein